MVPADIPKQWQEARANRCMQFKVCNYRDGSWESNIRLLTGTIKVDWIQLPVEQYLAALPTLKQGVIAGVFRQKGAAPWGITNAEKLQLSVFLPNELFLEDWYACENHVRELRTFFTVVLEPNIHTFSVLSETLQDFLKSKLCYTPANSLLNTELRSLNRT